MYCSQLENCCSIVEIGDFGIGYISPTSIKAVVNEYMYDTFVGWGGEIDLEQPHVFIATTKPSQVTAAQALKALGFKSRKMLGRHSKDAKDKYLTFWTKETWRKWW